MKKSRILLGLSLVGLLTGCGAPQQGETNNNNQQQVVNGKDGVGIKSITLTGSEGNVDIYTITYTDGTTSIFKVTNGKDGSQGIQGEPGKDGVSPTITIGENGNWIINGEDTGISSKGEKGDKGDTGEKGPQGDKGDAGNGIDRIELTDSEGNVDTYTIYFTDGTEMTFTITNGEDGSQGIQGETGADGKSAYEIFKEYNPTYQGTEEDWINDVLSGEFNKVKVSFDANGGELSEDTQLEIKKGTAIGNILPVPTKEGKEFLGWYTGWSANDVQISVNTPIYTDLNLIAKWDTYDVDFMNFDGSIFESFDIKHGETTSQPLKEPTKPTDENHSYYFSNWDFDFSQKIYSDIQITPVWDEKDPVFTIEFGSYPQSVVSDETIKKELALLENGTVSGTILEYDSDGDEITERYLCQETIQEATSIKGNKILKGLNYFKFEPIEWYILSNNESDYSVVSNMVLDAKSRNSIDNEQSVIDPNISYNNYEKSEIRKWLNEYFLNTAFNDEEKNKIPITLVDNSVESTLNKTNENICENTNDKIYLLSRKEAFSSPFSNDLTAKDEKRIAVATDYARAMGVESWDEPTSNNYGNTNWWTRSPFPGNDPSGYGYYILEDGNWSALSVTGLVFGVRPALHIIK